MLRILLAISITAACSSPSNDKPPAVDAPGSPAVDAPTPTSTACTMAAPQPRDATWTLDVGGVTRRANVHVPASIDPAQRTPVVINVHGRLHDAPGQASISHAIAKADAAGFIVVHPQSATSPTSWNAGGGCCDPAAGDNVDDSGFIRALLDELEAKLCVDPDRVYVMGLSNGGYLAHRLACELSPRIAAIGAVAGLLQLNPCPVERPMPVFMAHGTDDTLVDYSWSGATVRFWTGTNQCSTQTTTYQHGDASCVTHGGCSANADVVMCTIDGGGHQWPGGDALPLLGKKSDDLIATDALWDFFVAHPRN